MYSVFLVEDEVNLCQILTTYLTKEGWTVRSFTDGQSALQAIEEQPHLWILDIMLPDIDGYQLLRSIKEASPEVPVIFISARDADLDRIIGLEMGGDDYLAKPFLPRELVLRAHRLLERVYKSRESKRSAIDLQPYTLDEERRIALQGCYNIELTSKEYDMVLFFAKHRGQALSRDQIINHVWGEDYVGTDRSVDDLVRRLRRKMPELRIETIYGFGYRMTVK
ncbi:response regulator transcription factor [Desulfoscipio gibsoniae]|uniref:Stage 0 sporulation protein A homolog n=1 Tax=Desulfoscipio gibsoniae DSM 7213 TaxID=767817 RepID=R4KMJ7_9FIRM|nr:response regulator transcription factor [Desulfoscipio gibsoniae]AGL00861.1 response regulator with CheY-like receiver domain and winged-helix DNA-binding domain [Desulfoscipio gibsoniae DSM 7213]